MSVISLVSFYTPRRFALRRGNKGTLLPLLSAYLQSCHYLLCASVPEQMSFARRLFDSVFNAIVAARLPNARTGYLFVSAPSSIFFLRLSQQTLLQMHLSSEEVSAISLFQLLSQSG